MKIHYLKIIFVLALVLSPFLVFAEEQNMSGWAWSDNIGWISFNNTNHAGTFDYGVNKNTNGTLTGYAWSDNIGWIQFGGLSGFPAESGTQAQNAYLDGTSLKGWAKAIAGGSDGWDGWISLSGSNYGITLDDTAKAFCVSNTCPANDFAWGSDVVGWIDFNGVIIGSANNTIPTNVSTTAGACGTHSFTISWTAPSAGADSYNVYRSATSGGTYTKIANNVVGNSYIDSAAITGTRYYVVTALKGAVESANSAEISAVIPASCVPTVNLSATSSVLSGGSPTLTWLISGQTADSCTASGGWSGSNMSHATGSNSLVAGPITSDTTYTIYCSNGNGNSTPSSAIVTIGVVCPSGTTWDGTQCNTNPACASGYTGTPDVGAGCIKRLPPVIIEE